MFNNIRKKLYLSPNLREMISVVGLKSALKSFKYFSVVDVLKSTVTNKPSEQLSEMWNLMELFVKKD